MKKLLALLMIATVATGVLAGCSGGEEQVKDGGKAVKDGKAAKNEDATAVQVEN